MGIAHQKKADPAQPKTHRRSMVAQDETARNPSHAVSLSPAAIMRLQRTIGNQAVQRLLAVNHPAPPTNLLQTTPDPAVPTSTTAPESAPAADRPTASQSDPDEIEMEVGMYIGRADFHAKALPKNEYYATHPPTSGWPYLDRLKTLWEAGQYNDFADEVAGFQHFTLKLPEDQVDGILGPQTSRRLRESSQAETQPASEGETAQAGDTETTSPPKSDDPAVKNHTVALRILTPVKQAFAEYKTIEKAYEKANQAAASAKKADKAAKEEERKKAMEPMAQEREAARAVMATAREQVAALSASEFTSDAELRQVKAYINQQLNAHTIYYTQMSNADILWGNGWVAAWRTCNMTVISMILEALGKSSKDYNGDFKNLQAIAANFNEQLGVNNSDPKDLANLRLPDFLQLVAIDMEGSREVAAQNITKHEFITRVARRFGLQLTEIKGGQAQSRGEKAAGFLGSKFTSKLNAVGVLYRPAESTAAKEVNKDETYKGLKGNEREAYKRQYIQDFTEKKRLEFIANIDAWIDIDTQTKEQLTALQTEVNQVDSTDPKKARSFDAALQTKTEETIAKLKEIKTAIPKEFGGKHKQLNAIIAALEKARAHGSKKPDAAPKELRALFDGKQNDDPLKGIENNLKKYADSKKLYETLGVEGGIEQLIPVEQYKASIIPTMEAAISAGNQVMVNLENHFVRLQSVSEDGFVIDDPGSKYGEDNKITWEHGRKYGYFQNYLLLSS